MKFKDIILLPNLITISRLLLTIYLFFTQTPNKFTNVTLIFIIAIIGLSDSIDGIVARKLNKVSKLGIILDPVTDRIVFLFLIFWLSPFIDLTFILLLVVREVLVSIGGLYVLLTKKTVTVSKKGKIGTALIFISLCLSILDPLIFNINSVYFSIFVDIFLSFSLIFYYFVALEYLYNLIKNE